MNPSQLCVEELPRLDDVADLCIHLNDVDLKTKSACTHVTVKIGDVLHHVYFGCFKIPVHDNDDHSSVHECIHSLTAEAHSIGLKAGDAGVVNTCQERFSAWRVSDSFHMKDEQFEALQNELLFSMPDGLRVDLKGTLKGIIYIVETLS